LDRKTEGEDKGALRFFGNDIRDQEKKEWGEREKEKRATERNESGY